MPTQPRQRWRASAALQRRAQQLRKTQTPAEQKLWQRLRYGQLGGAHFRRQHAVGRFILDFFCAKAKLVIEVDGHTHAAQVDYDAERTRWLSEQKDYRILRFTNTEIHQNLEAVVEQIRQAVQAHACRAGDAAG